MGGLPHGLPPGMLKAPPPEMQQHREDNMKGPLGQVADDRLVSELVLLIFNNTVANLSSPQRNSVSPGDREKYRTRSPNDVDLADSKRRKDDKPPVHVSVKCRISWPR